jgi:hypothetical protein
LVETAKAASTISGDKKYQARARAALPLLVRQAVAGEKIVYSDLADELVMSNARNLNYVLGCVGQTLIELSDELDEEIPPIQCLVVNKQTGLPGEGIGWFLERSNLSGIGRQGYDRLNNRDKRKIVESELNAIYSFRRWSSILESLGLDEASSTDCLKRVVKGSKKGGGEGQAHKDLKKFIAHNPEVVGLGDRQPIGEMETPLYSGDTLDVSFQSRVAWVSVEAKSSISDDLDIRRGLYQVVKYRAVMKAMLLAAGDDRNVRVVLALEGTLPKAFLPLKNQLGVEVVEQIYSKA